MSSFQWCFFFLLAYENEDQLLWDPNILPEREVEEFLYRAVKRRWDELSSSSLPEGEMVKDNEQVLGGEASCTHRWCWCNSAVCNSAVLPTKISSERPNPPKTTPVGGYVRQCSSAAVSGDWEEQERIWPQGCLA